MSTNRVQEFLSEVNANVSKGERLSGLIGGAIVVAGLVDVVYELEPTSLIITALGAVMAIGAGISYAIRGRRNKNTFDEPHDPRGFTLIQTPAPPTPIKPRRYDLPPNDAA